MPLVEITKKQARRLFAREVRLHFHMTAREWLTRWDAGDYKDCDTTEVIRVAMLIPFWRNK
jgi:hypothetical protein